MKALITGANGFTAAHLIARLRHEPEMSIIGTDLSKATHAALDDYLPADLSVERQASELVRLTQPDWIFHLAGLFRGSATDVFRVNLMGALHLLESVRQHAPQAALLLVGSAAEYGVWPAEEMPLAEDHPCRPVGPYGISKYTVTTLALDFARSSKLRTVVARPFNLVGAGMSPDLVVGAVAQRAKTALANGATEVRVGNLEAKRDFISIEDTVNAYVKIMQSGHWGEVFNVCSGVGRSIHEIVQILLAQAPAPLRLVHDPALLKGNDAPLSVGDPAKIRRMCGFVPQYSLQDSLQGAWEATPVPPLAASAQPA